MDYKWQAPYIPREDYLFDFSSILHRAGTNMAVQTEMLRHFDLQNTINAYTQAVWTRQLRNGRRRDLQVGRRW
ncbi:hypothetical protein SBA2_380020 [Acidobacteriia bacterium SbA2]|nr:hypothetical protein SBA2_380020 [Acidobacteriia bacterium SbA2]